MLYGATMLTAKSLPVLLLYCWPSSSNFNLLLNPTLYSLADDLGWGDVGYQTLMW